MKLTKWLMTAGLVLGLAACGGGGGGGDSLYTPGDSSSPSSGSNSGGTNAQALSLTVQLLDENNQATTTLESGKPLTAKAILKRGTTPLPNQIVQFSIQQSVPLAELDPVAGSGLTDESGVFTLRLKSLGTATGAGSIKATASVVAANSTATTSVEGGANFYTSSSGTGSLGQITLGPIEFSSSGPISAYGTTGLKVRVLQDGQPYSSPVVVSFTSSCAAGKAEINSSATTQPDGYAVATFLDNGCAQTADRNVTVTATIASDTESGVIKVLAPTAGSLRFLGGEPTDMSITLKGQGGSGRQEDATLMFKLVDLKGMGVGDAEVCFDASTYLGNLNLDGFYPGKLPPTQGSDALCGSSSDPMSRVRYVKRTSPDGTVSVQINSGTAPTPVRVRARTVYSGNVLSTFSDTVSISTGLPLQRSFSLSIDHANIDGGNFDGETAVLTVRIADQFSNPVPDGTTVNFIASGGAVCTASKGSCNTQNGTCSCTFTSQERRPEDGRVVVTAYAVGLEDFDDKNGDNEYTLGDPFTDLGDAYVDANKDRQFSGQTINKDTDIPIPYQQQNVFKLTGDGVRGQAHLRASTIIYLGQASGVGDTTVTVPNSMLHEQQSLFGAAERTAPFIWLRQDCPTPESVPVTAVRVALDDGIGNPMGVGTLVGFGDTISPNVGPGGMEPGAVLALGIRPPGLVDYNPPAGWVNSPKTGTWKSTSGGNGNVPTFHAFSVSGVVGRCQGEGFFSIKATSPNGSPAVTRVLHEGEPRNTDRFAFDVRYRHAVGFTLLPNELPPNLTVTLVPEYWVPKVGRTLQSCTVNWGDGNAESCGTTIGTISASMTHVYSQKSSYTVQMTMEDDQGNSYVTRKTIAPPPETAPAQ